MAVGGLLLPDRRTTVIPAFAATSAMPEPMIPDPMMPMLPMAMGRYVTDVPGAEEKGVDRPGRS
jgi:hypothetical protein